MQTQARGPETVPFDWSQYRSTVPPGRHGTWSVERRTVSPAREAFGRLRAALNGHGRWVPTGEYTVLLRHTLDGGETVVMSDTPDEVTDHAAPIQNALGHCLVTGLGLGIVADACAANPDVTKVTVVERSPDVIALVAPHLVHSHKVHIVQADAFDWRPPRDDYYCMVWHDVWDTISADNVEEMRKLRRRFVKRSLWQGCWAEEMCLQLDREQALQPARSRR